MKSKASRSNLKTLTLTSAMPNDDDDNDDFQNPSQVIAITQNRILFSLQNPMERLLLERSKTIDFNGKENRRGACCRYSLKYPKPQTNYFYPQFASLVQLSLKQQNQHQNMGNCNGDVSHSVIEMAAEALLKASKSTESITDDIDDKSKPPVVQQKGRFKVTSEKVDLEKNLSSIGLQKSHSMQVISQLPSPTVPSPSDFTPNFSSLFQQMLGILQTSMLQRDYALSAMRQLCTGEQSASRAADAQSISASTVSLLEAAHEREKELLQEVTDLQWRNICKDDEIQRLKAKLAQANIT